MKKVFEILRSCFFELIEDRQEVYLSDFYWNKTSDDFTCEIFMKGRVLWVGLSFVKENDSIYKNMSQDSKEAINRLSKAKSKFHFVGQLPCG